MSELIYVEDIFIELYEEIITRRIPVTSADKQPMTSFYNLLVQGHKITVNQSKFILKLLKKYQHIHPIWNNLDLNDLQWKKDFRTIDMSRKVFVEKDENNEYWICLKFPYQLKNIVEKDIIGNGYQYYGDNKWDKDRRLRMLKLLDYNIVQIYDFVKQNNFEIEESFFDALATIEDIWQSYDSIAPYSILNNNNVELLNSSTDSQQYFKNNSTGNLNNDMFLAKTMGYPLNKTPESVIEKIASSSEHCFWVRTFKTFFDITENIQGTIAIVLDRNVEYIEWLKEFNNELNNYGIERNNVCVCFRESNKENKQFNNWIKQNNFNGKIENQKYLIFSAKLPKWLFNEDKSVKIVATNNLFLPNTNISKNWLGNHPCTIYLGNVKPSLKEKNIVEL